MAANGRTGAERSRSSCVKKQSEAWCASPLAINRLFVASDRVGITIVEMETGNTMNFSQ